MLRLLQDGHGNIVDTSSCRDQPKISHIGLALIWIIQGICNYWWLKVDTRPPYYDMAGHSLITINLIQFPERLFPIGWAQHLLSVGPYPPFAYVVAGGFGFLFWPTVDTFLAANWLFLGILMLAVYEIGRRCAGVSTGIFAALLISLYPMIYGLSRIYLLDLPLTAMVAASIACLFCSEMFRYRAPSIVLGIMLGLGMLTKWTLVIFVLGPLAITAYLVIKEPKLRLVNFALTGIVAGIIFLPWYLYNFDRLLDFLQIGGFEAAVLEGDPSRGTWAAWTYYLEALLNNQVLLPLFLLFLVGFVVVLMRWRSNVYFLLLLSWIVVPYVIFANYDNKDVRYTLPYLPAIALLTSIGIMQLRSRATRSLLMSMGIVMGFAQFGVLTFGVSALAGGVIQPRVQVSFLHMPMTVYSEVVHVASPPQRQDWQIQTILNRILLDNPVAPSVTRPKEIGVIPNAPHFEMQSFLYFIKVDHMPLSVHTVDRGTRRESLEQALRSDYLVTKSGGLGPNWTIQDGYELTLELQDKNSILGREFKVLDSMPLPDGSTAYIFRKHSVVDP